MDSRKKKRANNFEIYPPGLRLLQQRVAPIFMQKGYEFHVEYVKAVRNWRQALPTVAALAGAYRKRNKRDEKVVPHSFTFIQRHRFLTSDLFEIEKAEPKSKCF